MKKMYYALIALLFLYACNPATQNDQESTEIFKEDSTDQTNDFYFFLTTHELENPGKVVVSGEVKESVKINFDKLPLRSVIVKETLLNNQTDSFVGAYRYHGYSLYDILNHIQVDKANKEDFRPIIDLYVEIEGKGGHKTVISWGEIYYPVNRHQILVATKVTPIVPSKTKEMWPIPEKSKLVVGHDLYTHRNIVSPVKISIRSLKSTYEVKRNMDKLYSPSINLINKKGEVVANIQDVPSGMKLHKYTTTFYGRGRGIHGITTFKGYLLKELLGNQFPLSQENIQHGLFTIAAADGYRSAFTYAGIMNRNDQSESLLIHAGKDVDKGRFRLFHSADFFSDRAIKAVSEVKLESIR